MQAASWSFHSSGTELFRRGRDLPALSQMPVEVGAFHETGLCSWPHSVPVKSLLYGAKELAASFCSLPHPFRSPPPALAAALISSPPTAHS